MASIRIDKGALFSGLLIILVGLLFLIGVLGEDGLGDIFSTYWPLFLIFIGLWILITHNFRSFFGLLLAAIGCLFLLINLEVLGHKIWYYLWPVLIILFGLWVIFRPRFRSREKIPEIKGHDLDVSGVFSGLKRVIDSKEFRGGKASAIFGGLELDFTESGLAENEATVDVTAAFGGIEIRVPAEWKIIVDSNPIFGAIEDKRKTFPQAEDAPKLYIRGIVIFGGIEIKS
jgi:predicted membrane protein